MSERTPENLSAGLVITSLPGHLSETGHSEVAHRSQRLLSILLFILLTACSGQEEAPSGGPPDPVFTDVTAQAGLSGFKHETGGYGQSLMPEIVGGGGGFIDYDGDTWPDILLVAGGKWAHRVENDVDVVRLYKNQGDGTFQDVTGEAGLEGTRAYGFGVTVADYDNDGDDDFFLTTLHENMLFQNQGGRFENVAPGAGLADASVWSTSAAFFDADRDGWLDLFVGNYVDWSPETDLECLHNNQKVFCTPQEYTGRASRFYQSNGDGTFRDRTAEAGFWTNVDTTRDKTLGIAVFDYNRDGWPDVTTGNDTENDMLFRNRGDGTFEEIGLQSGVAVSSHGAPRAGMGIDTGVVDSTGRVSIFVGNFSEETVSVFRYTGNDQFEDRAAISRIAFPSNLTLTFGLVLVDIDLDADLDLLTANGHVLTHIREISEAVTFRQPPQLYLNRGDGVFDEFAAPGSPLQTPMVARGVAHADIDKDGDADILFVENGGPAHLLRNDTDAGNWLRVHLVGTKSNRDAIGTHVVAEVYGVTTPGVTPSGVTPSGVTPSGVTQHRTVRTGSSFISQSEKTLTFGLGSHEAVDRLRVTWPSGDSSTFTDVAAGQEILIEEGAGTYGARRIE